MPTTDHNHHLLDLDIPIFRPIEGVFSERQLCELFFGLEGQKAISTKYMYLNSGVETWKNRSVTNVSELITLSHGNLAQQYSLMNDNLDLILGLLSDKSVVNIVDIGPGSGYPTFPVLSFLQEQKKLGKYIAIDIAEGMCDLAINNLKSIDILNKMKTDKYVHDFEDGHFADFMIKYRQPYMVNLFVFVGSTLGGMVDGYRALANIRDSMTEGDLLWIGVTLDKGVEKLANTYSKLKIGSQEYYTKCRLFVSALESFGMENWMDFGKVIVQLSKNNDFLEYSFQIEKPFILEIPKTGKTKKIVQLKYQKGDTIILNILKNYHENRLITEFREAKLKVKLLTTSDDYRSALALVSV